MKFLNSAAEKFRECFQAKAKEMQELLALHQFASRNKMAVLSSLAADFHKTHLAFRNKCVIYAY